MHAVADEIERVLFTEEQIAGRVSRLAERIHTDYAGRKPILVAVLRGAVIFHADLIRQIPLDLQIDFISVASYGGRAVSSGQVQLLKDLESSIEGRHVILVEDIVDTGLTFSYLVQMLERRNPASLRTCALLSKPSRRQVEVEINYLGFEVPDLFVVGYGLDFDQRYRNLPYLAVLKN